MKSERTELQNLPAGSQLVTGLDHDEYQLAVRPYAKGPALFVRPRERQWFQEFRQEDIALTMFCINENHMQAALDMADIPPQIERLSSCFGELQWLALRSMQLSIDFTDFIRQELHGPGLDYIITLWRLRRADLMDDQDLAEFNRRLMRESRGKVFGRLLGLGFDFDRKALRLLPYLDDDRPDIETLQLLQEVASSRRRYQVLLAVLRERGEICAYELRALVENLPEWIWSEALLRALLDSESGALYELDVVIPPVMLELKGTKRDTIRRSLAGCRDYADLEKRLHRMTLRPDFDCRFPEPPFVGSELLRPIRSSSELYREGRRMNNCAATLAQYALSGRDCYYHLGADDPEKSLMATIQLSSEGWGMWKLVKYLGYSNKVLKSEEIRCLFDELQKMVDGEPDIELLIYECDLDSTVELDYEQLSDDAAIELRLEGGEVAAWHESSGRLGRLSDKKAGQLARLLKLGIDLKGVLSLQKGGLRVAASLTAASKVEITTRPIRRRPQRLTRGERLRTVTIDM